MFELCTGNDGDGTNVGADNWAGGAKIGAGATNEAEGAPLNELNDELGATEYAGLEPTEYDGLEPTEYATLGPTE